jgi:periplasmic protein TonB
VNQRRSSFVVLSVIAHALLLTVVIAGSILAPELLPVPETLMAWAPARVVQPVDIPLPTPVRTRRAQTADSTSVSTARPLIVEAAPVEPPAGISAETGREAIAFTTIESVNAIEQGGRGTMDGIGIAEKAPTVPPTPAGPVRLHRGIQAPRKIVDVAPVYPMLARQTRTAGIVVLDVIIDERGNVTSARVLKSVALLDQAAVDAVQRWKFSPARLNGEAIPIVMTVTVSFQLQ